MGSLNLVLICPPPVAVIEPWVDTPPYARDSLAFLAGYLRILPEVSILIIDAKYEQLSFDEVVKRVVDFKPDIIGLTAYTQEIKPAAYLAGLLKRQLPDAVTVIGGVHVTAIPLQTMQEFPTFDIAVVGEGEITLSELCQAIQNKTSLTLINGIAFRDSFKNIIQNPPREKIADINILPMPAWDLMPKAPIYFMHTQRGCLFKCTFCMNHNGRVARARSVNLVLDEMEYIVNNFAPPQINFGDELFSLDMERTAQLMDGIINRGLHKKVTWDAQTHVRFVNYDLLLKMKKANIYQLDMGVETGDPERLKEMGKGTNRDLILKAFSEAHKAGVRTGGLFIFGHPNETSKSIRNTIDLAVQLNPTLPMFGSMTPFPGTEVARLAASGQAGYLSLSSDWDDYKMRLGSGLTYRDLTKQKINFYMLIAYLKIYLCNFRFFDFLKFLWNYRKGAFQLLKKTFRKEDILSNRIPKPADYDTIINSQYAISNNDMIKSRKEFWEIQQSENKRLKTLLRLG